MIKRLSVLASIGAVFFLAASAEAESGEPPAADTTTATASLRDPRRDVPVVNYAMSAFGAGAGKVGASGGIGALGRTVNAEDRGAATQVVGSFRAWASPIDRLTFVLLVDPREHLHGSAPSATALLRFAGGRREGWAFAGSVTYKADGFDDLGGELEFGALWSALAGPFHIDSNIVFGHDFDNGEADAEFKTRLGFDLGRYVRAGIDGRLRARLSGLNLPGNRIGDFVGGPDIMIGKDRFYFDAFGGPSTVGVASSVGWTATGTLGVLVL